MEGYRATSTRGRIQGRRVRVSVAGYGGNVYAWKDTGATCMRGRIQGRRVRLEGYSGDVYAWEDTGATCMRGRTKKGEQHSLGGGMSQFGRRDGHAGTLGIVFSQQVSIPRVPGCMPHRSNWVPHPLPRQRVCLPP